MLTVLRLGDEAHGAAVREDLKARAQRDVSQGALFTTLDRLEGRGLVASRLGDTTPERGGRRRRYYWLRAEGRRALAHSLETVRRVAEGIEDQLPAVRRS